MKRCSLTIIVLAISVSGCSAARKPIALAPENVAHKVAYSGENFGKISTWYTGDYENWKVIAHDNPSIAPTHLKIGDNVIVRASLLKRNTPMPESFVSAPSKKNAQPVKVVELESAERIGKPRGGKFLSTNGSGRAVPKKSEGQSTKKVLAKTSTTGKSDIRDSHRASPGNLPKKEAPQVEVAKAVELEAPTQAKLQPAAPVSDPQVAQAKQEVPSSFVCRGQSCSKSAVIEPSTPDQTTKEVEAENHGSKS